MAAGITYDAPFGVEKELYRVDTGYRLSGGFNLAEGEIEKCSALSHIPVLCPIAVDFKTRTAVVLHRVRVVEAAAEGATSIKIAKDSFTKVNDVFLISNGQSTKVSAINKSDEAFDVLTVSALPVAVAADAVLAKAKKVKRSAVVYAEAAAEATSVKIQKGSNIDGACTFSDGSHDIVISAIDKSNAEYDEVTVTALAAKLTAGTTINEKSAGYAVSEGVANFLNYARERFEKGMSITALGRAFEVVEKELYIPLTAEDKASLSDRFMFI